MEPPPERTGPPSIVFGKPYQVVRVYDAIEAFGDRRQPGYLALKTGAVVVPDVLAHQLKPGHEDNKFGYYTYGHLQDDEAREGWFPVDVIMPPAQNTAVASA